MGGKIVHSNLYLMISFFFNFIFSSHMASSRHWLMN